MDSGWYVTSSDIKNWTATKKRESAEILPLLIMKLVYASCNPTQIHFPSHDSISIGDYDGIVDVEVGNEFVPSGKSVWELSTEQAISGKFEKDYKKRTSNPEGINKKKTSIVFGTPNTWKGKRKWCENKNKSRIWKKICGLDRDDLETWLHQCPSVHRWFAGLIGKRVDDILDIEQAMNIWMNGTEVKLTTDILLSEREKQIDELKNLLNSKACKIQVVAPSKSEALLFCVAVIKYEENLINRGLLVKSKSQWDYLMDSKYPLILLADNFTPNNIGQTINNGHHVIVSHESFEPFAQKEGIKLERLSHDGIIKSLNVIGFELEKAEKIYRSTRGYLYLIRQHGFLKPHESIVPKWVSEIDNDILLSILIVTEWDTRKEKDKEVLAKLSGYEYSELEKILNELATSPDAPIRLVSSIWQVISKINLWSLISGKINKQIIEHIELIIFDVLGEQDPSYDLKAEDRWLSSMKTTEPNYSVKLKNGLADSLALLSVYGDTSSKLLGNINLESRISFWVKKLLEQDGTARGWYSFGRNIVALAEAAPESFLEVIEESTKITDPPIAELFTQETEFGGCPHADLLWALESLSWNKYYLPRVVSTLARLSEIDPGGRYSNRPFNSLASIFSGWINNTTATHDERIEILSSIMLNQFEDITWNLILKLLPDDRGFSSFINKPIYRRWAEGIESNIISHQYWNYEKEIMRIFVRSFEIKPTIRIKDVVENITRLTREFYNTCLEILLKIDPNKLEKSEQLFTYHKLRDTISHHREFSKTNWALPKEAIDALEKVLIHFSPKDIILNYKYLFDTDRPSLLNPLEGEEEKNFEAESQEIQRLRIEAINDIYKEKGIGGLKKLITECDLPGYVGCTIVESKNYPELERILLSWLEEDNTSYLKAAKSYVYRQYYVDPDWFPKITLEIPQWQNKKTTNFLLGLPFIGKTLDLLEEQNNEVKKNYWDNANQYILLEDDLERINYVVENLLINKRPLAAVDAAAKRFYGKKPITLDCNLLSQVLIEIATNPTDMGRLHIARVKHDILLSIDYLQRSEYTEKSKLSQIEWMFIKFFYLEKQKPKTLEKEIQNNSNFFVELISWWFHSEEGEEKPEIDGKTLKQRADNASELLRRISKLPGEHEDGSIDKEYLLKWVNDARNELLRIKRTKIGDDRMGDYFSHVSKGSDGIWPHESVREVIEAIKSKEFDVGFKCGRINSRGTTWRSHYDGGYQERELAKKYFEDADKIQLKWPRTAAILRSIARSYEYDAMREDNRVELDQ